MPEPRPDLQQSAARAAFETSGAFLRGHFVYTSGRHGADYLEKFRILEDPTATAILAGQIAARFKSANPGLVAGPTTGGILLAYEVARHLGVKAVYAEPAERGRVLRRGFEIITGAPVLVVDDVVTTGGSLSAVIDCIRDAGGDVVGVGVLADRTGSRLSLDIPFFACLSLDFPSYPPDACPLCLQGVPLAAKRGSSKTPALT